MSGASILLLAAGGALSVKTLTVGTDGVDTYGYSSAGAYGSLSPGATYVDRAGTTRTIVLLAYNTGTGDLVLIMSGSVPDTDDTFIGLIVGGTYLSRAAATYASPSATSWTWTPGSNIVGTSGTKIVQLT